MIRLTIPEGFSSVCRRGAEQHVDRGLAHRAQLSLGPWRRRWSRSRRRTWPSGVGVRTRRSRRGHRLPHGRARQPRTGRGAGAPRPPLVSARARRALAARPSPPVHLVAHLVNANRGCGAVRGAGVYWVAPVKHSRPVFGANYAPPPVTPLAGHSAAGLRRIIVRMSRL